MFTNTGSSMHDLVIVVAFMGALFSGMTIWARKGGKPAGGAGLRTHRGTLCRSAADHDRTDY